MQTKFKDFLLIIMLLLYPLTFTEKATALKSINQTFCWVLFSEFALGQHLVCSSVLLFGVGVITANEY